MIQALFNIIIVIVLYTVSRLFFYLINLDVFTDVTFSHLIEMLGGGIRFDLTAVLYLSSVYLVLALLPLPVKWRTNKTYASVQKFFFIFPNAIGLLANCADMAYFRFTDRRTTCSAFTEFAGETNLFSVFANALIDYWYITIFAAALIALLYFIYSPCKPYINFTPKYYYIFSSVIFLISGYFTVIAMRGSFRFVDRPLAVNDAMLYAKRPSETFLVLNTPFSVLRTIGNSSYENPQYFADKQLDAIFNPIHDTRYEPLLEGKPNVVVFILESFGAEHIGFYNPASKAYTPFLDSIFAESIVYMHTYAVGRKSVDAPPAILSSIPKLYESFVLSSYGVNKISSVASVLNKRGYHSIFFHGAPNGSMGFNAYAKNAGFNEYCGEDEYYADPISNQKPDLGNWGLWDEDFFDFIERKLNSTPEPFCSTVFTLSSHHPFKVPEKYDSTIPLSSNKLCRVIAYTDLALRHLFENISRQPWFNNTIFVFVADHTSESVSPEFLTDEGVFRIPLAFYIPSLLNSKDTLAQMHLQHNDSSEVQQNYFTYPRIDTTTIASQVDIFPSLMSLVGCSEPFFAFGQDIISSPKRDNFAITFHYPYFQVISLNGYIQFDGTNIVSVNGDIPNGEQQDMLRYLKAYIQQYVVHLLNNTLY
ncbi:MAG: sulfatase-like hydrolase/transferase [Paludibacteraceae bacterium]|nr:sulfatase-like hydrolase/transferase [Paludibacteraceae bacterium]